MNTPKKRSVACPTCKQMTEFSPENPYRPFCSKRCKLIDLGQWASEQYAIPADAKSEQLGDDFPTQPTQ